MATIINSTTTAPFVLGAANGPLTITSTGAILTLSDAIVGLSDPGLSITNSGTIDASTAYGIFLPNGGTIANDGRISGGHAILINGSAGTVTNAGTIFATGGDVIAMAAGGVVSNTSTGTISSQAGSGASVFISGAAGTVGNAGTISGIDYSALLTAGGTLTNAATGRISGARGVRISGAAGTIINAGGIAGSKYDVISMLAGGGVTNTTGASISSTAAAGASVYITGGGGTVTNAGTIAGIDYATWLVAGGAVTNSSGGKITAGRGVRVSGAAGTVTNAGTIIGTKSEVVALLAGGVVSNATGAAIVSQATAGAGVYINGGSGSVTNAGTISGIDYAVWERLGGSVANNAGGTISAARGVAIDSGTGTVSNSGSIAGSTSFGVRLSAGGTVTNNADGAISGPLGVALYGTTGGTVVNNGAISGTTHAIQFLSSGDNRLIVGNSAVFTGDVLGSGLAATTNTLELTGGSATLSGLTPSVAGTVTLNGNSWGIKNFGTVAIDAGASLTFAGTNTLTSVLDNGTIDLSGSLVVTGAIDAASAGLIRIDGNNLEVGGANGASARIGFQGASKLIIDNSAIFGLNVGNGSYAGPLLQNFSADDTIDLKGFSTSGAAFNYNPATGLMQLSNGASQVASLAFETSSLASASFQTVADGLGGTLIQLGTASAVTTIGLANDTGTSSTDRLTSSPAVTGLGDPNAVVSFIVDGTAVATTTTASASGLWTYAPTGLADGTHTVVASESAGSASVTFTLDRAAPTITESLANDTGIPGDKITANTALTGTGDAGAIVTLTEGVTTLGTAVANGAGVWNFSPAGLNEGKHTIVASERDAAGNTGSASLTFTQQSGASFTPATFDHIVVVVEENHSSSQIIGDAVNAPYINQLAGSGLLLTNYTAITHPSQPNYFALYAGDTFGATADVHYSLTGQTLATTLQAANKSFVGYVDQPNTAFNHNPWESFPEGFSVEQNFTSFPGSNSFASLPTVSFVIPGLDHDMHNGTVAQGDTWLSTNIDSYAQWAAANNSLLVVVWDENDGSGGNQVAAILEGAGVAAGTSALAYNHYNLLSTILAGVGVSGFANAANATPINVAAGNAAGTISGGVSGPITLTGTLNPLTVTATGTVTSNGAGVAGIAGAAGTTWNVTNNGTINSFGGTGVSLAGAGIISSTGLITGVGGVVMLGGGTVSNSGSIGGTGTIQSGTGGNGAGVFTTGGLGTVTNSGTITGGAYGVALDAGGQVTNTSTIIGGEDGVRVINGVGTVSNSGIIIATVDDGVALFAGGTVTNNAGASISNLGSKGVGVYFANAAGSVTNAGSLSGIDFGIFSKAGGSVTNAAGGWVSGARGIRINGAPGTVANAGTVGATLADVVFLSAGGSVSNAATGTIASQAAQGAGVYIGGGAGTVTNIGVIAGVDFGVDLGQGGAVNNALGGAISASRGVQVQNGLGVVSNSGSIAGTSNFGVALKAGGTVTNNAGGSISGPLGVAVYGGTGGTVVNNGSISGTTHALQFFSSGDNRLLIGATSVFTGDVLGSTTPGDTNTLELTGGSATLSGLAPSVTGTVTLNSSSWGIRNFTTIAVDAGAALTLSANDTVTSILDNGTIDLAGGFTITGAIDAASTGLFRLDGQSLEVGAATGANARIDFVGASNLTIDNSLAFGTNVGNASYTGPQLKDFGSDDKIDIKGFNAAGAIFNYNAATGILQISNGASQVASLAFDAATFSGSTFQAASDGGTGTFIQVNATPAVSLALTQDTGVSGIDHITANPALTGTADANATVTLTDGGNALATVRTNALGAWTYTPTGLSQGAHAIAASVTNVSGNTGSATLNFMLDTTVPPVTEGLASDTGASGDKITSNAALTGSGDPGAVVTFTEGANTLGQTTADGTGFWAYSPPGLSEGAHTIVASETDAAGNTGSIALTFTVDTIAPVLSAGLTNDTGSQSNDGITSNPALSGTADANANVTLKDGGASLATVKADGAGAWTYTPVGLSQGAHTIVASETDVAGNVGSAAATFTLDTAAPAVTLALASDTGASGDQITSNTALTGSGDPGAIVTLTEGADTLGQATADGTGAWTFSPSGLGQGTHTIVASETDSAGNSGSAPLIFTLDTVSPDVTAALTTDTGAPGDGLTSNPNLNGTADPNANVILKDGGVTLATVKADGNGAWTYAPSGLSQGTHTIVASDTDAAGNTGSASVTFTLDTVAPVVTVALVEDTGTGNDGITANPALTGTAEANAAVILKDSGSTLATVTADQNGVWTYTPVALIPGDHTIFASETDAAGNTGSGSLSMTFTVLDAPPVPTADTGTAAEQGYKAAGSSAAGNVLTNDTDADTAHSLLTVTTVSSDAVPAGIATAAGTIQVAGLYGTLTIDQLGQYSYAVDNLNPTVDDLATGLSLSDTFTYIVSDDLGLTAETTLTITIGGAGDAPPTPAAPVLAATSDHGQFNNDNKTNVTKPVFTGTADPGATVVLTEGLTQLGTGTADANGNWSIQSIPNLGAGTHNISARQTVDLGLHYSANSSPLTVIIDLSAPVAPPVPVLSASSNSGSTLDNITNVTTPTFTGSAEPGAAVRVFDGATQLTGAPIIALGNGDWSFTPGVALKNGSHRIAVTATDVAGNTSSFSSPLTVVIDATAPGAPSTPDLATGSDTGISGTDNKTSALTTIFTGSAEANSTVRLYEGATPVAGASAKAASNGAWSIKLSAGTTLSEGVHVLTAKATDAAGNEGVASKGLTVTIDRTAPDAPAGLTLSPASDSGASNTDGITKIATPIFTGTAEAGSTVRLFADAIQVGSAAVAANGAWSITSKTLLDGTHLVWAEAVDAAGNSGGASVPRFVTIDTLAPATPGTPLLDVSTDSGLSGDNLTNSAKPLFTGSVSETGVTVKLFDGVTLIGSQTVSGATYGIAPNTDLTDGTHVIHATATDRAGNVSVISGSATIVVDKTAPLAPAKLSLTSTGPGTVVLAGTAEAGSIVSVSEISKGVLGEVSAGGNGTWTKSISGLLDEVHIFVTSATDAAGNTSVSSGTLQLASSGTDALSGTAGIDSFTFLSNFGNDTIANFTTGGAAHDIVNFHANGALGNFANVLAATTDTAGGAVISDGLNTLTFNGVVKASLTSNDFTFV